MVVEKWRIWKISRGKVTKFFPDENFPWHFFPHKVYCFAEKKKNSETKANLNGTRRIASWKIAPGWIDLINCSQKILLWRIDPWRIAPPVDSPPRVAPRRIPPHEITLGKIPPWWVFLRRIVPTIKLSLVRTPPKNCP